MVPCNPVGTTEAGRGRLSFARRYLGDVLALAVVVVVALKGCYGIRAAREPDLWDECCYMIAASQIPEKGLPAAEYAPLYSLWNHSFSRLEPDPLRLGPLNWTVLISALCIGLYLLTRALGGGRGAALLAASFALLCGLADVYPYLMYLATAVLLLATALATRLRALPAAFAVLCLAFLAVAYIRPEYFVAFALCCAGGLGAGVVCTWRRQTSWAALAGAVLAVGLVTAGALWKLGNPLGGDRSLVAFGQHYAGNVYEAASPKPLLHPGFYWQEYVRRDFGAAQTLGEAWRANPQAMRWHFGMNLQTLPRYWLMLVGPPDSPTSWPPKLTTPHPRITRVYWPVAACLAALGMVGFLRQRWSHGRGSAESRQPARLAALVLATVLVPTLAACLVIHPRLHYLLPMTALVVAFLGAGLSYLPLAKLLRHPRISAVTLALLATVLVTLTPNRAGRSNRDLLAGHPSRSHALEVPAIAQLVRNLHLEGRVNVLDFGPGVAFYSGLPWGGVAPWQKDTPFWEFVRRHDITMVVLSPTLLNDPHFEGDSDFRAFSSGERTGDFRLFSVRSGKLRVAVRKDLLRGHTATPGALNKRVAG
jgi:hypothetical protein